MCIIRVDRAPVALLLLCMRTLVVRRYCGDHACSQAVRGATVAKYKVLVGIDYPPNKRAEAGDIVDDLPSGSLKWLREQEIIEIVEDGKKSKSVEDTPVEEPEVEA